MITNKAMAMIGMIRQLDNAQVVNLPQKALIELHYMASCLELECSHEIERRTALHKARLDREQAQCREVAEEQEEIRVLRMKFGV